MIEEEQQGSERARYGAKVLDSLSAYLISEYGHICLKNTKILFGVGSGEFRDSS